MSAIPVAKLAAHTLLVSLGAVVGLKFIAATLADKHLATVLSSFVLFRRQYRRFRGEPSLLSVFCPHTNPIQQ